MKDLAICKICGSGSSGNMYLLRCNNETLILDLGLSWKDTLKALDYDISSIVAALVTHNHKSDHSRSVDNAIKNGIKVFSNEDVAKGHKGVEVLNLGEKRRIGGFIVQPISVEHNIPNYAYLIEHTSFGRLLFVTDCANFTYKLKNIHHFFIEANYDTNLIVDRMCNGGSNSSQSENHLSIDDTIAVLRNNFNANTQNIVLLHLSDENSCEEEFVDRVKSTLGFSNVRVADKGMEIELTMEEF